MTAREVLARVLAEGGQVIADPERPRIVVPPALESLVREHRGELRALIAANAAGAAHGSRETVDPEPANEANRPAPPVIGQRDTTGAYDACAACGVGTWIRFADIPLCRRCADARGALALAYWDVLGELDRLNAEGPYADSGACRSAVDHAARLTDDLGAELAIRLRGRWSRVTGRCPLCGVAAH